MLFGLKKMLNLYDKIRLQTKLLEFTPEIKENNIYLLKSYEDTIKLLNNVNTSDYIMALYLNKTKINQILYEEDKIIPIKNESMNKDCLKSMFYLVLAIKNQNFIINYSYESALIKKLYLIIKNEKNELKKYILYFLFDIILDNYQELNNTEESFSSDELEKISEEIKSHIEEQKQFLNNITKINIISNEQDKEKELNEIEEIYINIVISLIKNKKLDDYEYSKDIMEQLDLENIELTNKMYEEIKKLFDENIKEDYINYYQFKNIDNLFNERFVNFYFILFKYVFKNSIYLYNIDFLFETRKAIIDNIQKDYSKIKEIISLNEEKESLNSKIKFILKRFLDSEYYISKDEFDMLKEVLNYFNNFYFQSKNKEIREIEQILRNKDKKGYSQYMAHYMNARNQNKRFNILKYISDSKNIKFTEKNFLNNVVKFWKSHEEFIHDKKSNISKLKFKKEIFNYFTEEKNKFDILSIFKQDEIDFYIKNYQMMLDLTIIKTYYQNYFFESKKDEIEILPQIKDNLEVEKYLKDLELAKKRNGLYEFFSKVFKIDNDTKTEKEVQLKLKEWESIEKMLDEERFEIKDDDIKIGLFIYFNKEKNIESHDKILKEKSYQFLINQRKEVEVVILNYYTSFFPQTKKKEIESIANGKIGDEDLMEYTTAKNMILRKPIIFSLFDIKADTNENEIKVGKEKWEQIEKDLNNKKFNNIDARTRTKLNKLFKENTFIKEIFSNEIIDAFLKFNDGNALNSTKRGSSSFNSRTKKKKTKILQTEHHKEKDEKNNNQNSMSFTADKETAANSSSNQKGDENNNSDNIIMTRELFYKENIFKSKLEILMTLENKKLIIHKIIINGTMKIELEEFNKIKEHFAKEKESEQNKIFEFLDYFKQRLIDDFKKNFKLILGLIIEKKGKNYSCSFKFIPPSYPSDKILNFKEYINEDNPLTEGFNFFMTKINECNYESKVKHIIRYNQKKKIPDLDATVGNITIVNPNLWYNPKVHNYQILRFVKIIGDHYEKDRICTAEFIKELKNINCYISGGSDKRFFMYSQSFQIQKKINEIKDWIYSVCESRKDSFIFCSNKQLYSFSFNNNELKFNKYELPNMTCISALEMNTKIFEKIEKEKEKEKGKKQNSKKNKKQKNKQIEDSVEYEEKIISNLIIAGRNGVICFEDMFKDENNRQPKYRNLISDKTYRGIIQLNDELLAFTSNAVLPGGENKLIIFDLSKNKIKEEIEGYSYIASSNGMSVIDKDDKKLLLCGCKKYTSKQKNGILFVILNTDEKGLSKPTFIETKEFEVYCFCPIKIVDSKIQREVNDKNDYSQGTDFFFAGGFDRKTREGKIKLFKLENNGTNNVEGIKFLQDIEIDKTEEILTTEEENQNKPKDIFNGFKGAISSMIQSTITQNILVSCYDGKIYLLSKPNLAYYGVTDGKESKDEKIN